MTVRRLLVLAFVAVAFHCRSASAQIPVNASPVGCAYQACALRMERAFFGMALVKGSTGEQVSRLGGFGGGVDVLLAGPDSAASFARSYVADTKRSTVLGLLGALAYGAVAIRTDNFRSHTDATDVVLALGGAGLVIASVPLTLRAQRSLARSVWWYNAVLPR